MWKVEENAGYRPVRVEDLAVQQLFTITVDLSSAIQLNGDPKLDQRLRDLVMKTDGMITELRRAAASPGAADPATSTDGLPESGRVIELLRQAVSTVDWLLKVRRNGSEPGGVDLEAASQAIHRALIALSSPTGQGGPS